MFITGVFLIMAFIVSCLSQLFFIIIIENKIVRLIPSLIILILFINRIIYYLRAAYFNNSLYKLFDMQEIWILLRRVSYPLFPYFVVIIGCVTGIIINRAITKGVL